MKSILFIFAIFCFTLSTAAQINPTASKGAFDHLADVNAEWFQHRADAPVESISFKNDIDRISLHLKLVTTSLQKNTPANLSASQLENRLDLLKVLDLYADNKVFPTNTYHSERTPYFIDNFNVYCAVGHLIQASGNDALAQRIHDEYNFDYIRDIKTPGIDTWAKEHGFTVDELAWIQPGYQAPGTYTTVGNGTNGAVIALCKDPNSDRIYMAGNFSEFEAGNTCGNMGYIENDMLYCLGGGLNGDLTDVFMSGTNVVVSGRISSGGIFYSYAIFDTGNNLWSYHNIPSREGLTARTGISGGSDFDLQIALNNDQGANEHEVWTLSNGTWYHAATFDGPVNSIAKSNSQMVYAGDFDELTIHLQGSDVVMTTKNAMINEIGTDNWSPLFGQIADEVHKVKWLNGNFFFAGSAISHIDASYNSFSTIHADTVAPIYSNAIYSYGQSDRVIFYDFEATSDSSVVVCGDFDAGWMYFGRGVASIDYTNFNATVDQGYPYNNASAYAQGSINWGVPAALALKNTMLYVSGDFSALKNIVKFDLPLGFTAVQNYTWSVYPNPASNELHIKSDELFSGFDLFDLSGKKVLSATGGSAVINGLLAGTYLVRVYFENGEVGQTKIVKQ